MTFPPGRYTNKILVIDNFLDDPLMVLKRSRHAEYWPSGRDKSVTGSIHPDWIDIDLEDEGGHVGVRTRNFHKFDEYLFGYMLYKIAPIYNSKFGIDHQEVDYDFTFSKLKSDTHDPGLHQDIHPSLGQAVVAGIIYLNIEPPDPVNNGTVIIVKDKETGKEKERSIENKFNRLVIYDGGLKHRFNTAWGDTWDDCRLTLNIFGRFNRDAIMRL